MSGDARPHWAVYVLASIMGLAFLACIGLFVAAEIGQAEKDTWRWGFVDGSGSVVIPLEWEGARGFANGRAAVERDGLWGFIDRQGQVVVPPRFHQLCDYGGAQPTCAQDGQTRNWGYIDDAGNWVVEPTLHIARSFSDEGVAFFGRAVGRSSSRIGNSTGNTIHHFGMIDAAGNEVVGVRPITDREAWSSVSTWSEGKAGVQVGKLWGFVDTEGAFVLEPAYSAVKPFRNGYAGVSTGAGWGVIDTAGTFVVKAGHGLADGLSEGLLSGPMGYHTPDGETVGPRFEWVLPHSDGLGAVYVDKQWGFVDTEGRVAILPQFPRVTPFADGHALAAEPDGLNYRWGIIDRKGEWAVEPTWRGIDESGFAEGVVAVGNPP
jgi:hypothetical protein